MMRHRERMEERLDGRLRSEDREHLARQAIQGQVGRVEEHDFVPRIGSTKSDHRAAESIRALPREER